MNGSKVLLLLLLILSVPAHLFAQSLGPQPLALHTVGLHGEGTVYTWGFNEDGQLGDNTRFQRWIPKEVWKGDYPGTKYLGDNLSNKITAVALGQDHSIALAADGTVYSWGDNAWGQLGDNTTSDKLIPEQVLQGQYKGNGYLGDKAGNEIVDVALGAYHSIALAADGTVYTWGYNRYGQLGDGTKTNRWAPVKVLKGAYETDPADSLYLGQNSAKKIVAVALGLYHSIALVADGTVYSWGYNGYGHLGDGTTTSSKLPVQVVQGEYSGNGFLGDKAGSEITAVALGYYHSIALAADGKVYSWGRNNCGQLGDGATINSSTPVQVVEGEYIGNGHLGDQVGNEIIAVALGLYHSIALAVDGLVYSWGYNGFGQVGDGTIGTKRFTPVLVVKGQYKGSNYLGDVEGNKITDVALGLNHSIALAADGAVYTWGKNDKGQLGLTWKIRESSEPIKVGVNLNPTNQPPVADAGDDQTINCTPLAGAAVTLDGSGSSDPDTGDVLTYTWTEGTTTLGSGEILTLSLAPGIHNITLIVDDGTVTDNDTVVITINADTEAPLITLNGDNPMTLVRFGDPYTEPGAVVTDNCDPDAILVISGSADINLPGEHHIAYNAADLNGNLAVEVIRTVYVVDAPAPIHPYLLLADKKIKINQQNSADGDIFSNDKIDIHKGPATYKSKLTAVKDIHIHKDNTIEGNVMAGKKVKLGKDVNVTGTVTENATVTAEPMPVLSFSAGGSDIKVEHGQIVTLTPGSYRKIEVKKNGELILGSGDYYADEFKLDKEAKLTVDVSTGPVTVNVVKKFGFKNDVVMTLLPLGEADSRYVIFNILKHGPGQGHSNLHIEKGVSIFASIVAPECKVHLQKEVYLRGSICAKEINVDKSCVMLHHDSAINGQLPRLIANELIEQDEKTTRLIALPQNYELYRNYPNPFNPTTNISFALPEASEVSLKIYNTSGQLIRTLVLGQRAAGVHAVSWNATDNAGAQVASGMYFCILRVGENVFKQKMILMK